MKRRDNLKLLLTSTVGVGLITEQACNANNTAETKTSQGQYGRTEEEAKHDIKMQADSFLDKEELNMISVLSDLIIPKDEVSGSASEAGVPAFIDFIVKDMPQHQLPMRGGLRWLNHQCNTTYQKDFVACTEVEQKAILDLIAYPDKAEPQHNQGVKFFNLLRNLVATGFFTSKIGLKDLGYKGNTPNEWDGVPDEVLKKYNLTYDAKYKEIYVKPSERGTMMEWS